MKLLSLMKCSDKWHRELTTNYNQWGYYHRCTTMTAIVPQARTLAIPYVLFNTQIKHSRTSSTNLTSALYSRLYNLFSILRYNRPMTSFPYYSIIHTSWCIPNLYNFLQFVPESPKPSV